jgi:hypothetical protein
MQAHTHNNTRQQGKHSLDVAHFLVPVKRNISLVPCQNLSKVLVTKVAHQDLYVVNAVVVRVDAPVMCPAVSGDR